MSDHRQGPTWTLSTVDPGGGGGGGSGAVIDMLSGEVRDFFSSPKAMGPFPSDMSESDDVLHQMLLEDLWVENSTKTQALDRMETGEEKYPNWEPGKLERTLRLQRAWVVHGAWASIENVCKISSNVLVNKLQCEHIANHFKVTGDVLKKLGLGKDFVSGRALEGGSDVQTNLTFDERRFSRIVETFEVHNHEQDLYDRDFKFFYLGSRIQDTSSLFEDYVRELDALDGSIEESLSMKPEIRESLLRMSTKENVETRSGYRVRHRLDRFLCLLFGVLKQGEDLVMSHSGLEGADNEVVEKTGLYGDKFVQIHELLYMLLDFYACLEHCEGTEFAQGYLSQLDSCGIQSLHYYLNSNCLGENASLFIDDDILNIELAIGISKLLERPDCALKILRIGSFSRVKVDNLEELQECRLLVIAALSKCVSIKHLFIRGANGEEVYELCSSLSANEVLETLALSTDGPLADINAMDLSAMLKENRSLKSFILEFEGISSKGAAYLGAMLAENSSLEELSLRCSALNEIGMRRIMWPLMTNMDGEPQVNLSLKHLHIDPIGECLQGVAEIMAQILSTNKTLTHFSIEFKDLDPCAACKILDSVKENRTLQVLNLLGWSSFNNNSQVAICLEAMLAENSTLHELKVNMHMLDEFCLKHLLKPLMANEDGETHVNISLRRLHILNYIRDGGQEVVESIAQMLCTNKTLSHFSMITKSLEPSNVCKILDSLKINKALQVVNLEGWSSFCNNFEVATCLETMLVENSTLEELKVDMFVLDEFCLNHLLRPLMANKDGEPHVNISLKRLHILHYYGNQCLEVAKSIAQMLRTNETLSHFSITNASFNTSNVCEILDSLKTNKALQVLNLDECTGLDNPQVKVAFMDLLVNYNFTLHKIRMHGRDWDIEAFMKSKLELDTIMSKGISKSHVGGIFESSIVCNAYDFKQALEDFQIEKGEGSSMEVHGSSQKAFEEYQEELFGGCPKVIFELISKLEVESEQSLRELTPTLELVMKSTNFLLQRNLNMAQLLQEQYTKGKTYWGMYPSNLTNDEKDELSKGCITATLFPTTFLYHLKTRLLQGTNPKGILHMLKEVTSLVVQRVKSLQDSRSPVFQFIDYGDIQALHDIQHIYSTRETIAICQTFSTKIGIEEELQAENFIQYGIVQDHLTGAYYFNNDKASHLDKPNLDKSTGVIGVKVASTEIQVEIMWEDGSYYSGALEDFSYNLEPNNSKLCALEAFGDLKGAHFLRTWGLKCSPLLIIALAMAIQKRGLTLMWGNGKGHIQYNTMLPSLQPKELEVWECQILFGGDINQLGETVEWGMHQFDRNHASFSRVHRDNQCQVVLESDVDQNMHISHISNNTTMDIWNSSKCNDTSSHTSSNVDLSAVVAQFNAGAQNKQKLSIGVKVLGSGGDIGFEKQNLKGKKVEHQSFEKMQELYWKEKGGYVIGKLSDRHELVEEKLYQGSLYAERDLNYLVVYDGRTASHISIYWAKEWSDEPRLELEWITDIFIKEGPEEIKSIFKGLKGETLEVTRTGTYFLENPSQQQSKGLMKRFINHLSNKGSCKGRVLQMVSKLEGHDYPIFEGCSNDEWEHLIGLQPDICCNDFWWKASYMQAITYSRTRYSSGLLLSTHTIEDYGLKWGSCKRKFRPDGLDYVHKSNVVKSCGKFSKAPQSLSSKWHDMIHWGGLKETLV